MSKLHERRAQRRDIQASRAGAVAVAAAPEAVAEVVKGTPLEQPAPRAAPSVAVGATPEGMGAWYAERLTALGDAADVAIAADADDDALAIRIRAWAEVSRQVSALQRRIVGKLRELSDEAREGDDGQK